MGFRVDFRFELLHSSQDVMQVQLVPKTGQHFLRRQFPSIRAVHEDIYCTWFRIGSSRLHTTRSSK